MAEKSVAQAITQAIVSTQTNFLPMSQARGIGKSTFESKLVFFSVGAPIVCRLVTSTRATLQHTANVCVYVQN